MFNVNSKIFVVRPNTSQDPLKCHERLEHYTPVMILEFKVASEPYKDERGNDCFDVYGDSGTENKGQTEGTRKINFHDVGLVEESERADLECYGLTRTCLNPIEAINYKDELLNEENYENTMSIALEIWGFNTEKKHLDAFIKFNKTALNLL